MEGRFSPVWCHLSSNYRCIADHSRAASHVTYAPIQRSYLYSLPKEYWTGGRSVGAVCEIPLIRPFKVGDLGRYCVYIGTMYLYFATQIFCAFPKECTQNELHFAIHCTYALTAATANARRQWRKEAKAATAPLSCYLYQFNPTTTTTQIEHSSHATTFIGYTS